MTKISSGYSNLDRILNGGFECPSLVTICSRSSMGKTNLALNLSEIFSSQMIDHVYVSYAETYEQLLDKSNICCRVLNELGNIGEKIIIIDYMQLVVDGYDECISSFLHNLKKDSFLLNQCVILLCQIDSNLIDKRQGHRPKISDLPEGVESYSDQIFLLHRRDFYDSMDKPGIAELILVKNRFGKIGTCELTYDSEELKFLDYTPMRQKPTSV